MTTPDSRAEAGFARDSMFDLFDLVEEEILVATSRRPPFNSAHEGFAVLQEEFHELWAHVKTNQKRRDLAKMKAEAVQVAAMAMRFALEVCDEERGRK